MLYKVEFVKSGQPTPPRECRWVVLPITPEGTVPYWLQGQHQGNTIISYKSALHISYTLYWPYRLPFNGFLLSWWNILIMTQKILPDRVSAYLYSPPSTLPFNGNYFSSSAWEGLSTCCILIPTLILWSLELKCHCLWTASSEPSFQSNNNV